MQTTPELINSVPNICGMEEQVAEAMQKKGPYYLQNSNIDFVFLS